MLLIVFYLFYIIIVIFTELCTTTVSDRSNNVCKTLENYYNNIETNSDCWYDPDVDATPEEIGYNHGFILEPHIVKTIDNYLLTTYRVKDNNNNKGVVFLQHGYFSNCKTFILNGNNSLAFFLARKGYDVWLGNYRDSQYCKHKYLSRTDARYWNFSFHENGLYDLSANFNYIHALTRNKIIYIGHSMGGTGMGVYTSVKAKEAEKVIQHAILVSANFYMKHISGPFKEFVELSTVALQALKSANMHVFLSPGTFEYDSFKKLCSSNLEDTRFCLDTMLLIFGYSPQEFSVEKLPHTMDLIGNGCVKTAIHYLQLIHSGEFRMFNYGKRRNMIQYNSTTPPDYNLSAIPIPVTLVYGEHDLLATKEDIIYVYNNFKKDNWEIYGIPYNHADFLLDKDVVNTFYPLLMRSIDKFNNK